MTLIDIKSKQDLIRLANRANTNWELSRVNVLLAHEKATRFAKYLDKQGIKVTDFNIVDSQELDGATVKFELDTSKASNDFLKGQSVTHIVDGRKFSIKSNEIPLQAIKYQVTLLNAYPLDKETYVKMLINRLQRFTTNFDIKFKETYCEIKFKYRKDIEKWFLSCFKHNAKSVEFDTNIQTKEGFSTIIVEWSKIFILVNN
jgi:hypothetical protein